MDGEVRSVVTIGHLVPGEQDHPSALDSPVTGAQAGAGFKRSDSRRQKRVFLGTNQLPHHNGGVRLRAVLSSGLKREVFKKSLWAKDRFPASLSGLVKLTRHQVAGGVVSPHG